MAPGYVAAELARRALLQHPSPPPTVGAPGSFWLKSFDSPHDVERPLAQRHADVVIIGSGITGVNVADQLVSRASGPLSIVVVDARGFCSGATGRNGGHCTSTPRLEFASLVEAHGLDEALRCVAVEDLSVSRVVDTAEKEGWDVDLVRGGNLRVYDSPETAAAVQRELKAAEDAGVDVTSHVWQSSVDLKQRFGIEAHAGVFLPGSNLHPRRVISALFSRALDRAATRGVSLSFYPHTLVRSISAGSDGWVLDTSRGSLSAKRVVHATNGYTSGLLPELASGPDAIVPTRGQVVALDHDPGWTNGFSGNGGMEYWFQRPNHSHVILGGARDQAAPRFEYGVADDSQVNELVGMHLRRYLATLASFPPEVKAVEEWTGIMGFRTSHAPLVGRVFDKSGEALPGRYVCAGYSGHGMSRAPACADFVASMLLADLAGVEVELPDWLPRHYLARPPSKPRL